MKKRTKAGEIREGGMAAGITEKKEGQFPTNSGLGRERRKRRSGGHEKLYACRMFTEGLRQTYPSSEGGGTGGPTSMSGKLGEGLSLV